MALLDGHSSLFTTNRIQTTLSPKYYEPRRPNLPESNENATKFPDLYRYFL